MSKDGENPEVVMTCGNIGTGKTTTIEKMISKLSVGDFIVVSEDALAKTLNLGKYGREVWTGRHWPVYSALKRECVAQAIAQGLSVFVDGAHVSKPSRKKILDVIPRGTPVRLLVHRSEDGLSRRIADARGETPELWENVHNRFASQWDEPTADEGFTTVEVIRT